MREEHGNGEHGDVHGNGTPTLKRRGLIAGAVIALDQAKPAAANDPFDVVLGALNTTSTATTITNDNGLPATALILNATNSSFGVGSEAKGNDFGVRATGRNGVLGGTSALSGSGVQGLAGPASGRNFGVSGSHSSPEGAGVYGSAGGTFGGPGVGVFGNTGTFTAIVTLWPGGPQPTVSNINYGPSSVIGAVANSYVVGLADVAGHRGVNVFDQSACDYILVVAVKTSVISSRPCRSAGFVLQVPERRAGPLDLSPSSGLNGPMEQYLPKIYVAFREAHPDVAQALDDLGRAAERSGPLDERTQRLVKIALAIGSLAEGAVRSNARKAVGAGDTPEEIRHVALLAITTCGFPTAIAGLGWVNEVLGAEMDHRVGEG